MILTFASFDALTTLSDSLQSKTPLPAPSISLHWNSVFCQPKPASTTFCRSRCVVPGSHQMNTFIPYSGLRAR